ncbi:MAG: hypothetical protein LBS34_00165 [Rickettsiales bacterium]|jgi:chromosomal replication initiation ATPase DnaA|nr:hypothetical protein [Rickettsiales bacterium]
MQQLGFDFLNKDDHNINNFIIHSGNVDAYYFLNRNKEDENILNNQVIFLTGEKKCGKTYLGMIWKQKHNAKNINYADLLDLNFDDFMRYITSKIEQFDHYFMDNFDENLDENRLFYLLNSILNNKSSILVAGEFSVLKKKIKLKDLASRINSAAHLKIKKLPKDIKPMFIAKLFSDRQLYISGEMLKYLTKKLETKYESIVNFIDLVLDKFPEK